MAPTISERVARFAAGLRLEDIPPPVIQAAKEHILDAVGVGLAAASLPAASGLFRAARQLGGGGGRSTALGFARALPAASAALLNGALIHSLEYDDTHIASVVHGSSAVVSAALAMAEEAGSAGGDLLRAVVLGWELLGRLGLAAPGQFQERGFQITAVGGPFAAALAGCLLAEASLDQTVAALGIAGSQSSGVFEYLSDGATVKSLHPGWAAHAGLVASLLARGGMTGPRSIFEGRFGFMRVYAGDAEAANRLAAGLETLGQDWILPQAAIKGYPCCHYIHPFLEGLSRAVGRGLGAAEVATIECAVPPGEAPIICDPWERKQEPASGYEAKFSLPYCLSALMIEGDVTVDTFARPAGNPAVLALAHRISWRPMARSDFPRRFAARLTIVTKSGQRIVEEIEDVRGAPTRPFRAAEISEKFRNNAARRLVRPAVDALHEAIFALDKARDLAEVAAALSRTMEPDGHCHTNGGSPSSACYDGG